MPLCIATPCHRCSVQAGYSATLRGASIVTRLQQALADPGSGATVGRSACVIGVCAGSSQCWSLVPCSIAGQQQPYMPLAGRRCGNLAESFTLLTVHVLQKQTGGATRSTQAQRAPWSNLCGLC